MSLLNELPKPDKKKKGWPWKEESEAGSWHTTKGLPKISIITPSFNQGDFIEETIRSVLLQNYPNLEYIIIDGGSTDNSLEIIKKYEPWLTYWTSERDNGQSDAINKGFNLATGEYGNWINSDDLLEKNALHTFSENAVSGTVKVLYVGKCLHTDINRNKSWMNEGRVDTFDQLIDIKNHWRKKNRIAQQSVMFNIQSYKEVGGLNVENHYSMDYELWGDLLLNGDKIRHIDVTMGIFRHYEGQKISDRYATTKSLIKASKRLLKKNNSWNTTQKISAYFSILNYQLKYLYGHIRSFIGIKRRTKSLITKIKSEV